MTKHNFTIGQNGVAKRRFLALLKPPLSRVTETAEAVKGERYKIQIVRRVGSFDTGLMCRELGGEGGL